jgi:hypothetical protein
VISPATVRTLVAVAHALEDARDHWWLIGGAAVALHGLAIDVADVDVLMSEHDLRHIMTELHLTARQGMPVDRIRSDIWVRWTALPLSVDLMTGLQVRRGEEWVRVTPITR